MNTFLTIILGIFIVVAIVFIKYFIDKIRTDRFIDKSNKEAERLKSEALEHEKEFHRLLNENTTALKINSELLN